MKKEKKQRKSWSKKKKIILYPIISFLVIIALLSACTAAGFMTVEHDVKDTARQKRYIEVYDEILGKKKQIPITTAPKADDFYELREMEEQRAEKDGYIVKMENTSLKDAAGNVYDAKVEFWINKNMKHYAVDGISCKKVKSAGETKKPKQKEKKNAESWTGKAVNVTDDERKAAYENILKGELGDRTTSKLKFSGYKMTEKKAMSGKKKGYDVTVSCDKIRIDNGKTYHKGSAIAWVNKDALSKYKLKKLTFDGKDATNSTNIIKSESSGSVSSSDSSSANDWNSTTKKVTDSDRIATYETLLQTELDKKEANLKYPWDYNEYDMVEKKYTYQGKNGYMASVECDKISVKNGDTNYHSGRIVFWTDKNMNEYTVSLLEFDGESVL